MATFGGDAGTLEVPGRPRVIPTPGHSPGHVCFHLPDRGVLIAGDALGTYNPSTGARGPQILSKAFAHSAGQALQSLAALEGIDAPVTLFGHGDPWTEGPPPRRRRPRARGRDHLAHVLRPRAPAPAIAWTVRVLADGATGAGRASGNRSRAILGILTVTAESPTSEHAVPAVPPAPPRRRRSTLSLIGAIVSILSLGAVVWWASRQEAPQFPHTPKELAAVIGAIALYGLATLVRAERWQRLLEDEGATPRRPDTHALTAVGYMGNNVLPARAGDAIRVVLMAPRAARGEGEATAGEASAGGEAEGRDRKRRRPETSARTVVGTLLAERLLDVAVLVVLFVVVGWGLLGEVGGHSVELIAGLVAGGAAIALVGWRLVRRNERLHGFIAPIASATLGLRRAHHGLRLLGITLVIWSLEVTVWMSVGAAVGFGMNPVEGAYLVALASVFSMIPSGPAYAGTQDAAVVLGIKALGGTGGTAVAYLVMLRFVIVVPITLVGLVLLIVRYGGLQRLRAARAAARA